MIDSVKRYRFFKIVTYFEMLIFNYLLDWSPKLLYAELLPKIQIGVTEA